MDEILKHALAVYLKTLTFIVTFIHHKNIKVVVINNEVLFRMDSLLLNKLKSYVEEYNDNQRLKH